MRPKRKRAPRSERVHTLPKRRGRRRSYRRSRKKGIRYWLFRFIILLCLVSALPMVALRYLDPPTSSFIELNKLKNNKNIKHQWKDIEDISAYFAVAVIASEDQLFPEHFGFDVEQIMLVLDQSKTPEQKGYARGASTITQQTIKNLFLWPGRSFLRKGIEAWLVLWMELIVPKKRILELYLNFAQFGTSVFGAGAASQHYFGIPAAELNPHQSALIAASLPTPVRSNPADPSEYLLERAAFIEDQMPRIGGRRLISEL